MSQMDNAEYAGEIFLEDSERLYEVLWLVQDCAVARIAH